LAGGLLSSKYLGVPASSVTLNTVRACGMNSKKHRLAILNTARACGMNGKKFRLAMGKGMGVKQSKEELRRQ
jgi:hypothetical protein